MSAVIAQRKFDVGDAGVGVAEVYEAQPKASAWRCNIRGALLGSERNRYVVGVGSWQAVALAMNHVAVEILVADAFKSGLISDSGQPLRAYEDLTRWLDVRSSEVLQ